MAYTFNDLRYTSASDVLKDGKSPKPVEMVGPGGGVANWKEVNFFMGGVSGTATQGRENDWRHIVSKDGSIDFSGDNAVSSNVLLIPEAESLEVKGGVSLSQFSESVDEGKSKILDLLNDGVQAFTGTKFVPEWNAMTFTDLKQLEVGCPMEFKFHYGSAGLYSGYEEVVKPIIALILFFGVEGGDGDIDGHISVSGTNVVSPYPTKAEFLMEKVKSAGAKLKGGLDSITSAASLANGLAEANTLIQSVIAGGAQEVATSSAYRNVYLQWGRLTIGPLVYEGLSYSMTMKDLDDNGWPVAGSFKVEGLKSMRKATTQAMLSPFIKGA